MQLQTISTDKAPKALGPYSQAIAINGFIFLSGQIPIDPKTGNLITGSTAEQTQQVLNNLAAVLASVESNPNHIVKTTVYLQNMSDFDEMNKVYAEFFGSHKPARVTIEAAKLPKGAKVEIDAIAVQVK